MGKKKLIQTENLDDLNNYGFNKIVAAIGVFDGIHLGHRKLIHTLLEMSEELSAIPIIITFFPHPRKVLMHDENLRFLRNPDKKLEIISKLGVKAVVTVPFTIEFASLPPEDFIRRFLLPDKIFLKGVCVGSNWKFGNKAQGDSNTLNHFAKKYNFKFSAVNELHRNKQLVSSTAIRKALKAGDFTTANFMLDCIYSITGKVISIFKQSNNYTRLHTFIEFGILPPIGEYNIYIKIMSGRTKAYANVLSEEYLDIYYPNMTGSIEFIEFEFINKINSPK